MKRQENRYNYSDVSSVAVLCILGKTKIEALIPREQLDAVRLYHWANRGKSGIMNEFNVSLGALLAEKYGYPAANWRRIDTKSMSFMPENYSFKLIITGKDVKNWKSIENNIKTPYIPVALPQTFFPRTKWASKYQCTIVQLKLAYQRAVTAASVPIVVNTYLLSHVPQEVRIVEGKLCLLNGTKLSKHLIEAAGGVDDNVVRVSTTLVGRNNQLDYRIDPSSVSYVATLYSHRRMHRVTVDGADCIVIECRDSAKDAARWHWNYPTQDELFLNPITAGASANNGWRTSFVMFDAALLSKLQEVSPELVIFYSQQSCEWMVSVPEYDDAIKETRFRHRILKRVLMELAGKQINHQYFPPRMTTSYAKALAEAEKSETFGEADRRRARFENATGENAKLKMFTKPHSVRRRKVIAQCQHFETSIYGGVGIWVKDLRIEKMLIKTNAQLKEVVVDSKADIHKVRT